MAVVQTKMPVMNPLGKIASKNLDDEQGLELRPLNSSTSEEHGVEHPFLATTDHGLYLAFDPEMELEYMIARDAPLNRQPLRVLGYVLIVCALVENLGVFLAQEWDNANGSYYAWAKLYGMAYMFVIVLASFWGECCPLLWPPSSLTTCLFQFTALECRSFQGGRRTLRCANTRRSFLSSRGLSVWNQCWEPSGGCPSSTALRATTSPNTGDTWGSTPTNCRWSPLLQ